jgi:hypothetical protein
MMMENHNESKRKEQSIGQDRLMNVRGEASELRKAVQTAADEKARGSIPCTTD